MLTSMYTLPSRVLRQAIAEQPRCGSEAFDVLKTCVLHAPYGDSVSMRVAILKYGTEPHMGETQEKGGRNKRRRLYCAPRRMTCPVVERARTIAYGTKSDWLINGGEQREMDNCASPICIVMVSTVTNSNPWHVSCAETVRSCSSTWDSSVPSVSSALNPLFSVSPKFSTGQGLQAGERRRDARFTANFSGR
jgi:hypothetical protein